MSTRGQSSSQIDITRNFKSKRPDIIHREEFEFNNIKFTDEEYEEKEEESHYCSCIVIVRLHLNLKREETAISSPHLFVKVSVIVKDQDKPLILMVRKSNCYVEAFGTIDCLWEFGNGLVPLFDHSLFLKYDGNYNTLFAREDWIDLNMNNSSLETSVRKIIKENKLENRRSYVFGWKKHIGLIIFMVAEASRFGPICKEFNISLATRNTYMMKTWVPKTSGLWEKMSDVDKEEPEDGYEFALSNDQINDEVIDEIMQKKRRCKGLIKVLHYRKKTNTDTKTKMKKKTGQV